MMDGAVEFSRFFCSGLPKKTSWKGFCLLLFLLVAAFRLWLSNFYVHEHLALHFLSHSACEGLCLRNRWGMVSVTKVQPQMIRSWWLSWSVVTFLTLFLRLNLPVCQWSAWYGASSETSSWTGEDGDECRHCEAAPNMSISYWYWAQEAVNGSTFDCAMHKVCSLAPSNSFCYKWSLSRGGQRAGEKAWAC